MPPRRGLDAEHLVDGLLAGLRLETTTFHVGRYCGRWRASTAGRALASYHLVLTGRCYVHLEGHSPIELGPREGILFLRDVPHFLSFDPNPEAPTDVVAMQPLPDEPPVEGVGLACGFFHFRDHATESALASFPESLVLRADSPALAGTSALFELILAESSRAFEGPSPLVSRLAELLLFYALRHVALSEAMPRGFLALARHPALASLARAILEEPGKNWSIESMARGAGMSRARFFKHFIELSGTSPAQFLLVLRMRAAAARLKTGETIADVAEHVGYQSIPAFSRAFKKTLGEMPGAFRRSTHASHK